MRERGWGQTAARNLCEDFAPRNGAARLCEERGANRAPQKPARGRRQRGICVKILLPAKTGRGQTAARNLCEDFAPRNGAARLCEERGANRAPQKPAGGRRRRGICVKILLPETEP